MADKTTIANMAAARIGEEMRITSLDDDRNVARTLKAAWDIERQAAIRDGAWNFAVRRDELAAVVDPGLVIYPWQYGFELPASCLRLLEVMGTSRDDYALEGGTILANTAGPLYIRYLVDEQEPALWDASFTHAFALRLAWRCGRRLAGSAFDQDQCWAEYRKALSDARRVDARENPGFEQEESSWVTSRFYGRGWNGYEGRGW